MAIVATHITDNDNLSALSVTGSALQVYRNNAGNTAIEAVSLAAADLGYTPSTLGDWNSSTDPGETDDALDQLASRVKANEASISGLSSAFSAQSPVLVATAAVLPNSPTYDNGTAGVGATLTDGTSGAVLVVDGVNVDTVGQRVLVKNQASGAHNGIYELTTAGVASTTPWVLTRVAEFDEASDTEIVDGAFVGAQQGTANADKYFVMTTSSAITVGTTSLDWEEMNTAQHGLGQTLGVSNTSDGSDLNMLDDDAIQIGTGTDFTMSHDGTNTTMTSATGNLVIDNTNTTGQTILDLGTNDANTELRVHGQGSLRFSIDGAGTAVFGSNQSTTHLEVVGGNGSTIVQKGSAAGVLSIYTESSSDIEIGSYTKLTGTGSDTLITAQTVDANAAQSGSVLIRGSDDGVNGGRAGFVKVSAGQGSTKEGQILLADNQANWVYFGQTESAGDVQDVADASGNEGFAVMTRITGISAAADPAASGAPDGALVYDVDNDIFFARVAGAWKEIATEDDIAGTETLEATLAAGNSSGANDIVMDNDQTVFLGDGTTGNAGQAELCYVNTSDVAKFRGVADKSTSVFMIGSAGTTEGTAGSDASVQGGGGADSAGAAVGADGGDASLRGATGGASHTATHIAGAGGDAVISGGDGGTDNGAGGAAGGKVTIDAGAGTGAAAKGNIEIGNTNVAAMSFGNGTDNPAYTFNGTGAAGFGGDVDATGNISANGGDFEIIENSGASHDVIKLRRIDGSPRYLYINNSDALIVDNAQPA